MTDDKKIHSEITPEEIAMLNGVGSKNLPSGVDRGFRIRHLIIVVLLSVILGRLLFFPGELKAELNLPAYMGDMSSYFQLRGGFALLMIGIYSYSYVKDWHFPRIAMIAAALSVAGLISDFFNIYRFIIGAMPTVALLLVLARCVVIYCLVINSVRDNRAPPMPRHFFS